jgi:hypothetical protein
MLIYSKAAMEASEEGTRQSFSKDVHNIAGGGNLSDNQLSIVNMFPNPVVFDVKT